MMKTQQTFTEKILKFVNEYDKRRGTDFEGTFKELNNYYKLCAEKSLQTPKR